MAEFTHYKHKGVPLKLLTNCLRVLLVGGFAHLCLVSLNKPEVDVLAFGDCVS